MGQFIKVWFNNQDRYSCCLGNRDDFLTLEKMKKMHRNTFSSITQKAKIKVVLKVHVSAPAATVLCGFVFFRVTNTSCLKQMLLQLVANELMQEDVTEKIIKSRERNKGLGER